MIPDEPEQTASQPTLLLIVRSLARSRPISGNCGDSIFVQSVMAWVVLVAGALLMLAGLAGGSIFTQPLWTGSGALKMALFIAIL